MGENAKRAGIGAIGLCSVVLGIYAYAQIGSIQAKAITHSVVSQERTIAFAQ